jgi:hypothetical protein
MVFTDAGFEIEASKVLVDAGLSPPSEEYKGGARMDGNKRMSQARDALLHLVGARAKVAVVVGPFHRPNLGRQVLQALQSVVVRNGIERRDLEVYFDREVFASQKEALRLQTLFTALHGVVLHAHQDSKLRPGIQAADAVAYSLGQVVKESLVGTPKMVDIGGEGMGYPHDTMAPLGWELLMRLRSCLLTRPVVLGGSEYPSECDPAVLDPHNDDQVEFGQNPVLLGWGVQVAPESGDQLRVCVEKALGKLWLGCIH